MRIVGDVRVSTEEQGINGCSLAAQTSRIRDYCQLYGLELLEIVSDAGESAKSLNRTGLQKVLGMLDSQLAEGAIISKLDRLTRSIRDWEFLISKYFNGKCSLLSVSDQIDTRTASGRLVLNLLVSVSQWEREAIGERTAIALQHKRKQGIHTGRNGYGFQMKDGKLVPDADEQQNIALAVSLKQMGWTFRQIAGEFLKRGIPAKRGGQWRANSIRSLILRNRLKAPATIEGGTKKWSHDEKVSLLAGVANATEPDGTRLPEPSVEPLPSASPKN